MTSLGFRCCSNGCFSRESRVDKFKKRKEVCDTSSKFMSFYCLYKTIEF